jgi:hypothetical protein
MKKHITAKNPIKPFIKHFFGPLYGSIRITDVEFDTKTKSYYATLHGKFITDAEYKAAGHSEMQGYRTRKYLGRQAVESKELMEFIHINFGLRAWQTAILEHNKLI